MRTAVVVFDRYRDRRQTLFVWPSMDLAKPGRDLGLHFEERSSVSSSASAEAR